MKLPAAEAELNQHARIGTRRLDTQGEAANFTHRISDTEEIREEKIIRLG